MRNEKWFSGKGLSLGAVLRRARKDQSGVTAIEFAMVMPILIALAISTVDLGLGIYTDTQLANSAQSGAYYAVQYGYVPTGINTAAQSATALKNLTITPSQFCGCPQASGAVTQTSCGSACSDGLSAGTFAQVAVAKDYTPILSYPGLPAVFHLSKQAIVRLQ